jgi:transposase
MTGEINAYAGFRALTLKTSVQTLPGVGPVVASTLMGELGDLREFAHPKALAAFAELAPAWREIGSSVLTRAHMTKHGSGHVRRVRSLSSFRYPGFVYRLGAGVAA